MPWASFFMHGNLLSSIILVFLSLSYWSCEAQIIQRPLSAKGLDDAAVSYLGVGFWHALVSPLIIVIPGIAAVIGTAIAFSFARNGMMLMAMAILAIIMPPTAVVILLGAVWKGAGKTGALWGIMTGFAAGIVCVALDFFSIFSGIAENTMYLRTTAVTLVTFSVTVIISLVKREISPDMSVYHSEIPLDDKSSKSLFSNPRFLAVLLLLSSVSMYLFLTFAF